MSLLLIDLDKAEIKRRWWAKRCIEEGFEAIEQTLSETMGLYCVGDTVSMADVVLYPQIFNARRWEVDMKEYPNILKLENMLSKLSSFTQARPEVQPDALQ